MLELDKGVWKWKYLQITCWHYRYAFGRLYISVIYSDSTSDIDIVKKSGFIDVIEEGDDVMADRGFNIRHLLLPRKATLNIPAFTRGKQLSKQVRQVLWTRKVAPSGGKSKTVDLSGMMSRMCMLSCVTFRCVLTKP